jgi:hypothetical protein
MYADLTGDAIKPTTRHDEPSRMTHSRHAVEDHDAAPDIIFLEMGTYRMRLPQRLPRIPLNDTIAPFNDDLVTKVSRSELTHGAPPVHQQREPTQTRLSQ